MRRAEFLQKGGAMLMAILVVPLGARSAFAEGGIHLRLLVEDAGSREVASVGFASGGRAEVLLGLAPAVLEVAAVRAPARGIALQVNAHGTDGAPCVPLTATSIVVTRGCYPPQFLFQLGERELRVTVTSLRVERAEASRARASSPTESDAARDKTWKCPHCGGTHVCQACNGAGSRECAHCWGTGVCPKCAGTADCPRCSGKGVSGGVKCWECNGDGHCTECWYYSRVWGDGHGRGACRECKGTGKASICSICNGTGKCAYCS